MKTFKVLSALLTYPSEELVAAAPLFGRVLDEEQLVPPAMRQNLDALIDDPHLAAVGLLQTIDQPGEGPVRLVGPAATWSATPPSIATPAPRLGEHGAEILREAGFGENEIERLTQAGALVAPIRA